MNRSYKLIGILFCIVLMFGSCANSNPEDSLLGTSNPKYWQEIDKSKPDYKRAYLFKQDGSYVIYEYNTEANGYKEYTVDDIEVDQKWAMRNDSLVIAGTSYHVESITDNSLIIKNTSGTSRTFTATAITIK